MSGKWPFGSGCREADWMMGGFDVFDGDVQRLGQNGQPVRLRMFVPASDCTIHDTWDATGLRGTGSHDWSVDGVFVPDALTQPATLGGAWPGLPSANAARLFAGPHFAAVALGIARAAIEGFTSLAKEKKPVASPLKLREQPEVQTWLGRAEALVASAHAWRDVVAEDCWRTAVAGDELTVGQRATTRLCATFCVDNAIEAVELLCRAAGTTSLQQRHPLSRCWRDVHAVGQNFNVAAEFYAVAGRAFLGLDPGPRLPVSPPTPVRDELPPHPAMPGHRV